MKTITKIYDEVSVKGIKRWKDKDGKQRQETRKFFQTISPFNPKTRDEIMKEILKERQEWLWNL